MTNKSHEKNHFIGFLKMLSRNRSNKNLLGVPNAIQGLNNQIWILA